MKELLPLVAKHGRFDVYVEGWGGWGGGGRGGAVWCGAWSGMSEPGVCVPGWEWVKYCWQPAEPAAALLPGH